MTCTVQTVLGAAAAAILLLGTAGSPRLEAGVQTTAGVFPASFVGYDGDTGFGLVRARALAGREPMPVGESSQVRVGAEKPGLDCKLPLK